LLNEARQQQSESLGTLLELYRNYLTILATTQLDQRLRRRVSPSDVVQETMLAAHRDFLKFRGTSEREFLGWLRQILVNCMHRTIERHLKSKRRDARREVSMERVNDQLDRSAADLSHLFVDQGDSPSQSLHDRERAVMLANQLAKLRPQYRDVIVLRNLQGMSFEEVAERMERNPGAVRMLWLRAIEKLKEVYEPSE